MLKIKESKKLLINFYHTMTTFILRHALGKAINNVNHIIEEKISRGQSYAREARLHKRLITKLRLLERGATLVSVL